MEFKEFNSFLQQHVAEMTKDENYLFTVDLDKDELWDLYLDSYPEGTNKIFRTRRDHDCSCCRHFVKSLGNVVSLKDNKITTIWDFQVPDKSYQTVINALSAFVKSKQVTEVFMTDTRNFGTPESHEAIPDGHVLTWHHFNAKLDNSVEITKTDEIGSQRGNLRDIRNVLKRSLEELSRDSVETVLDLISQNSLYKGEEWKAVLKEFLKIHKLYRTTTDKENFCWKVSTEVGAVVAKIKNHSIGVLLTDISEGMDLNSAVKRYEKVVAPTNYKRPKAIFTKKMVEQAQKTVKDLGLEDSLGRRYANINDITVNNIIFANRTASKALSSNVFDDLAGSVATSHKNFNKVEEVTIENFLDIVSDSSAEVEVLLENKHAGNMVSLIAPSNKGSKSMFKWDNGFSWAYSGNITDSMKERVKAAGGRVDGVLRFSIQWNEHNDNLSDLDAHCIEPNGNRIYYGNRHPNIHKSSGMLDVDITRPKGAAVENITWSNRNKMPVGTYLFLVHNYRRDNQSTGFKAEIEFDGSVYSFDYAPTLKQGEEVKVAEVTFDGKDFTLKGLIPSNKSSKDMWNLKTNQFYPVNICMYSPNYWDGQQGIGHRHYFFMIEGCKNEESPNGFFNEFLQQDLMKHKHVFEALGERMKVSDSSDQLSGLGFSSTKHDSLIVKVKGSFNRTLKVKF